MEARKLAEGEKALLDAAKNLKTGWFKKADHEAAAADYEKAATAFRVGKAIPRAIDAFRRAAHAHVQFDSGFMAAKHMETAAFLVAPEVSRTQGSLLTSMRRLRSSTGRMAASQTRPRRLGRPPRAWRRTIRRAASRWHRRRATCWTRRRASRTSRS